MGLIYLLLKVVTADSGGSLGGWAGKGRWLEPYVVIGLVIG